jgi:hypothetical protein
VEPGIHPAVLPDTDLFRELGHLYETRLETLRHGSQRALSTHSRWMRALECEACACARSERSMSGGYGRVQGGEYWRDRAANHVPMQDDRRPCSL